MDDARPDCLSDYRLDKLMAGELGDDAAALARAHVASCAWCTARAAAFEEDRDRYRADLPARSAAPAAAPASLAAAPPASAPRVARTRRRLHRFTAPVVGLAAAAALALFLWPRRTTDGDGVIDDPSRAKGGPSLGFYLGRDGRVTAGASGDQLAPGDQVRFAVTSDRPGYLVIGSVDAAGRASIYHPAGPRAERFEAGTDQLLPDAIALDQTLGREQVVGFFCDRPIEVARALAALSGPDAALPGCRVDRLEWTKRVR